MNICTKTLRTKLEPVHFDSEIWASSFFSERKKHSHYANESTVVCEYLIKSVIYMRAREACAQHSYGCVCVPDQIDHLSVVELSACCLKGA